MQNQEKNQNIQRELLDAAFDVGEKKDICDILIYVVYASGNLPEKGNFPVLRRHLGERKNPALFRVVPRKVLRGFAIITMVLSQNYAEQNAEPR